MNESNLFPQEESTSPKRLASRSDAQQAAEITAINVLNREQGWNLEPSKLLLRERTFSVDGYYEVMGTIILAEVWAHIGKAKSAQRNKVLADILKLALLSKILREQRPSYTIRSYMVFIDEEASLVIQNESWGALAAMEFGIQSAVVPIGQEFIDAVKIAQQNQDLRHATLDGVD